MKKTKLFLSLIGLFLALPGFGQSSEIKWVNDMQQLGSSELTLLVLFVVILGIILVLLGVMAYLMTVLNDIFKFQNPALAAAGPSKWEAFKLKYITGRMKPVGGKEEQAMMLDHSYDGIVELDNKMPPWLVNVFYVTIAFAIVYFSYYSVLGLGLSQYEEYENELFIAAGKAEERKLLDLESIDEYTVTFDSSTPSINAGRSLYEANCAACHALDGGGGVGPNLTDAYWIHGGDIKDIFRIVKYGVVEKGMIPWQDQLSPEEMQRVSSYILTLQETTPLNPKAPQGDKYEPAIEQPTDTLTEDELGLEKVEAEEKEEIDNEN